MDYVVEVSREKLLWARNMIRAINRPRKPSTMYVTLEDGHLRFSYRNGTWGVPANGDWPSNPVVISALHFRNLPEAFLTSDPAAIRLEGGRFCIFTWSTDIIEICD